MAGGKSSPFDPETLLEMQRRNLEAFTSAGRIIAEGMRTATERQTAMMQEAMQDLMGEFGRLGEAPATGAPTASFERMRAAFERALQQLQELNALLLRVHGEALGVLNACAAANLEAFRKLAPHAGAMHRAATDAVQKASEQASTAIDELKKRMADLEEATKRAEAAAKAETTGEPPKKGAGARGGGRGSGSGGAGKR